MARRSSLVAAVLLVAALLLAPASAQTGLGLLDPERPLLFPRLAGGAATPATADAAPATATPGASPATAAAAAPGAASPPAPCPVDPSTLTIDFSGLPAACPSASAAGGNSSAFCDTCICALVEIYKPAFDAAGITAPGTGVDGFIEASMGVIGSCTSAFLAPLLASRTDISGLQRLASECSFTADNVPDCLTNMLSANMDNATTPAVVATQGAAALPATTGAPTGTLRAATPPEGGEYVEDGDVSGSVLGDLGSAVPVGAAPAPAAATPGATPAAPAAGTVPEATPAVGPDVTPATPAVGTVAVVLSALL
ncbi:hypothetical protein FOA52_004879 [Chlamydomonas sp. UWO 241]|nr:hypothetical protein FOA52_004879 [Chlamydomonas sp. UWO 241]